VEPKDARGGYRGYSPSRKIFAVAVILIFFFGGGWASLSPTGGIDPSRGRTGIELAGLERSLSPSAIAASEPEAAATRAERLVHSARLAGVDPRESLDDALPEARNVLGMLALDRDVDDYDEYADLENPAGDYYREQAQISRTMRALRPGYEAIFAAVCSALSGEERRVLALSGDGGREKVSSLKGRKSPYIAKPGEVWLPRRSELRFAHPYALDVFFFNVDRSGGGAERGPLIRALYPGLVVAAAGDWTGGAGVSTWKSGGLSPAAGNGVVLYDPSTRRYVSYFHLSSVTVHKGELVGTGQVVGRGGNSGMNARKAGHGEHVHIEIFDTARDAALSSEEILDLLKY
jgi:murein DD-endopeptidase MepM/ murein hydrolase activator NlpD